MPEGAFRFGGRFRDPHPELVEDAHLHRFDTKAASFDKLVYWRSTLPTRIAIDAKSERTHAR